MPTTASLTRVTTLLLFGGPKDGQRLTWPSSWSEAVFPPGVIYHIHGFGSDCGDRLGPINFLFGVAEGYPVELAWERFKAHYFLQKEINLTVACIIWEQRDSENCKKRNQERNHATEK